MKEKYYYNLGNGKKRYRVSEIASELNLDLNYIKEVLEIDMDDINYACMEAAKEKATSNNILFLLKRFNANYIASKNIFSLIRNYHDLCFKKNELLRNLEEIINCNCDENKNDLIVLSKTALDLLFVNSESNFSVSECSLDEVKYIKNLRTIISCQSEFNKEDIELNSNNPFLEMADDIYNKSLVINKKNAAKLLEYSKTRKLPKKFNEFIFDSLVEDFSMTSSNDNFKNSFSK